MPPDAVARAMTREPSRAFAETLTDGTNRVSSVAGIRRTREVSGCPVRGPGGSPSA